MKKTRPDVLVGQMWRDRDPRMLSGNRRVRIIDAEPLGHVVYRAVDYHGTPHGPTFRSQYQRFQRAFEVLESATTEAAVDPAATE